MQAAVSSITRMEEAALAAARQSNGLRQSRWQKLMPGRQPLPDEYWAKRELEHDFWYQKACANRDYHRIMAQLYALVSLAERPVDTMFRSPE
jgi:hypothetical protein